ncbi:MAG: bifunctional hydroxymethylpyrimidine kinase/phosphomethylpyrimidine kinase [Euryarchaeota archaeon]|nr:bifunctional hydroxymethylpyrimidine kinase/phosphomethylpyrimidine kinase [Euryarchaeota archaeon]
MRKKIALSIAGSDPSGGAGIQADLKAFTTLGLHGVTAITCITAQNTKRVKTIHKLPVQRIESQIDTILEDMQPDAAKTGMLYDKEIVNMVAEKIKQYRMKTVVDPVMVATSGDTLSKNAFVKALKNKLIPISYMVTPNIQEANALTGRKINDVNDAKKACKEIQELGPNYVLIKGGHLKGKNAEDVLFDGKDFTVFSLPMIPDRLAHGSGCTLSALITGFLALEEKPVEAVRKAKHVLWNMIDEGYKPGKGADVLNFSWNAMTEMPSYFTTNEHFAVWLELKKAVDDLLTLLPRDFIPEVGMNVGYALQDAKKLEDICAINGRIVKTKDKPVRYGSIEFGVSKHVASIILAAMKFDRKTRCAMNLKYSDENIEKCKKIEFKIGTFDRIQEPREVKSTMEWGTTKAIQKLGFTPDIIYDTGGKGKEPMIRILGKNPKDVVNKARILFEKI